MRIIKIPTTTAKAATPNDTTEVKSEARRNEAVITVCRTGSSWASCAYVWPPLAVRECLRIVSASVNAVIGSWTSSPAKCDASSDTTMCSSPSCLETSYHVTAPATISSAPAMMTSNDSTRTLLTLPDLPASVRSAASVLPYTAVGAVAGTAAGTTTSSGAGASNSGSCVDIAHAPFDAARSRVIGGVHRRVCPQEQQLKPSIRK